MLTRFATFVLSAALLSLPGCSNSPNNTQDLTTGQDLSVGTPDLSASVDMTSGGPDLTVPVDMFCAIDAGFSCCGTPCDTVGNSIGVGKYCTTQAQCTGNKQAIICAVIGQPDSHFCTAQCTKGGPLTQCGDGASCQCTVLGCACVPNYCLGNTDPRCKT